MNDDWMNWIRSNLEPGCEINEIKSILKKNGFSNVEIESAVAPKKISFCQKLKNKFNKKLQKLEAVAETSKNGVLSRVAQSDVNYQEMSEPAIVRNQKAKRVEDDRIQLYVLDNFLSHAECHAIVKQINSNLRPSTVTTGSDKVKFRTSSTCDLGLVKNKVITQLDKKISRVLGMHLSWSETIQGQKYEVGQEFKAHTDYFEPNSREFESYADKLGQRTWTFMVYLNNTPKGGGTHFTKLNKTFYPKAGRAVIWNNLYANGEPNADTKHCGMPVLEGSKIIITKWFRDKGKGQPFLGKL